MEQEVTRITSFSINHDILLPGLYVSRVDGDVTTYDMRTRRPNTGDLMDNSTMHSLEHMFATYIRNGDLKDSIVYFGPMARRASICWCATPITPRCCVRFA